MTLNRALVFLLIVGGVPAHGTDVHAQAAGTPAGGAGAATERAEGAQSAPTSEPQSTYDRVWTAFTQWHKDDSHPVVQQVLFSGRYQHEFVTLGADQGDHDEWNVRRMRLGPRITLFRSFIAHAEVELNPQEADPLYVRFTDAYLQWTYSPRLAVTVGKQGVPFTVDGGTSSKELLTIDRSNLSNNVWFPQEYMPGVSFSGRRARWVYRAGIYSSGASNREFGELSGGVFTLGSVGYDLASRLGAREALLSGQYVYQQPDADNTFTRQLEHVGSLNYRYDSGRWGVRADLSGATGYLGQGDLWGAMVMPFVNVTAALQIVGRYTLLSSDEPNSVRLSTYESRVVTGRGDRYDELYLGANYYFYGHKLKLQTGFQFADLDDRTGRGGVYSGVSWTSGLRVSW